MIQKVNLSQLDLAVAGANLRLFYKIDFLLKQMVDVIEVDVDTTKDNCKMSLIPKF